MLLIENGYMIDPKSGKEGNYDFLIRNGKILRLGKHLAQELGESVLEQCERIDASGLLAAPGLVDVHVHFRDPGFLYKEDIESGAKAAARGGFTTVVLMANTRPCVDNPETLRYVLEKGRKTGIHVETCANVTLGMKGQEPVPMEELAKAGAVGFTDDGIPLMNTDVLREAMRRAAALDMPVSLHEEDPSLIADNGINRGRASEFYGIGGSPREAEISLVERDLQLALQTGASVNIQHISTREGVELVRRAKRKGRNIHAEATPHHFTLTEEAAIQYGTLAKMNPPLRLESDRQAIIRGLADGTIDMIATDHAPHSAEEKARGITEAPSGIIGLETALPLAITELVGKGYMTMKQVVQCMSFNPAGMYHLNAGYLAEGGPADLVLVDTAAEEVAEDFSSRSQNSPFLGRRLKGVVRMTICDGKIVYQHMDRKAG